MVRPARLRHHPLILLRTPLHPSQAIQHPLQRSTMICEVLPLLLAHQLQQFVGAHPRLAASTACPVVTPLLFCRTTLNTIPHGAMNSDGWHLPSTPASTSCEC